MLKYYNQPLNFFALINGAEFLCPQKCENKKYSKPGKCSICERKLVESVLTCSVKDSIAQRLHLILITNLGECRFDKQFGNLIWDHDFENIANINTWKDTMSKAVKEAVEKFEYRLFNIKTSLDVTEEEFMDKDKLMMKKLKKKVAVKIQGNIKTTNEQFFFQELLYVSPLWMD